MAAPNIVGPTTITAKTAVLSSVTGATGTVLLSNAAASGKAFQVTTLYVSNVDGSSAADVTIKLHAEDDGAGTGRAICSTVSVPAGDTQHLQLVAQGQAITGLDLHGGHAIGERRP